MEKKFRWGGFRGGAFLEGTVLELGGFKEG